MEEIKQNFVIVCESAVIDKYTNKLYLLGIFTNIKAKNIPAVHPLFTVVTNFSGGVGEHSHRIIIRNDSNAEMGRLEGKINFGDGNQNAQYIGQFIGFPFSKYGTYYIYVYIDEKEQSNKAVIKVSSEN